jgi:plasmid stabilization system protein ParE
MSQVIITRLARADLLRIYFFLDDIGASKQAKVVVQLLRNSFQTMLSNPKIGRKYILSADGIELNDVREVIVPYGKSGYSYLYRYDENRKTITILTVKHFRERTYQSDLLL